VADRLNVGVAARLSRYLQVLTQARKMGKTRISSQEIAEYTNINATQIRRDLSMFGKFGKRGVGYSIESLLDIIRKILRTQGQHNVALVGRGGSARRSRRRRSSTSTGSTSPPSSTPIRGRSASRSGASQLSRTSGSGRSYVSTTSSSEFLRFRRNRRSGPRTTSLRPA